MSDCLARANATTFATLFSDDQPDFSELYVDGI